MTHSQRGAYRGPLSAPQMTDSPTGATRLRREIQGAAQIAVDTESNSLYAYHARVCLIQLSTYQGDFLIDPFALDASADLAFLGEIFADPAVEKVLHAAEYDIMMLRREYGYEFAGVFDTMIAARVLGWEQIGLGPILEERYGIHINKRHQRANWGQRPLPAELLRYAQTDTHFLLDLRGEMHRLLEAGGRLEEAREMFSEVCAAEWNGPEFDPDGYWRLKDARELDPSALAVLRELYLFREHWAEQQNIPVFKVMGDTTLIELARAKPHTRRDLAQVPGMSASHIRRYGAKIISAVHRGLQAHPPSPPARNGYQVDESVQRRYEALHTWRKERGLQRGVASDVVVSREALWELARTAPRTYDELAAVRRLGPWRLKAYGEEILRVLADLE